MTNAYDTYQANIIKALLEQGGIPVLEKHRGSGAYMEIIMGVSSTGIELYVPAERHQEALALLASLPDLEVDTGMEMEDPVPTEEYRAAETDIGQPGTTLIYILLVIGIIYGLYKAMPLLLGN